MFYPDSFLSLNSQRWNYSLTLYAHFKSFSIYCLIILNWAIIIYIFTASHGTTLVVRIKVIGCKMFVCAPLWWHCASRTGDGQDLLSSKQL